MACTIAEYRPGACTLWMGGSTWVWDEEGLGCCCGYLSVSETSQGYQGWEPPLSSAAAARAAAPAGAAAAGDGRRARTAVHELPCTCAETDVPCMVHARRCPCRWSSSWQTRRRRSARERRKWLHWSRQQRRRRCRRTWPQRSSRRRLQPCRRRSSGVCPPWACAYSVCAGGGRAFGAELRYGIQVQLTYGHVGQADRALLSP